MSRKKNKKIDPDPTYRWCDNQDKFVPVAACKEKTKIKARCRKCFEAWDKTRYQMPLPLKIDTGRNGTG